MYFMPPIDFFLVIGFIGALLILIGFILNELHRLTADSRAYDVLNLVGSLLLLIYAIAGQVWPFVLLNSIWALVALRDVVKK